MEKCTNEIVLFKALAHPARLAILEILRGGEQCVCHMEAVFGYRQAYISQQLMVLREAGLLEMRREGLNIYYRVTRPEIFAVMDAMRALTGIQPALPVKINVCTCPNCAGEHELPLIQL